MASSFFNIPSVSVPNAVVCLLICCVDLKQYPLDQNRGMGMMMMRGILKMLMLIIIIIIIIILIITIIIVIIIIVIIIIIITIIIIIVLVVIMHYLSNIVTCSSHFANHR